MNHDQINMKNEKNKKGMPVISLLKVDIRCELDLLPLLHYKSDLPHTYDRETTPQTLCNPYSFALSASIEYDGALLVQLEEVFQGTNDLIKDEQGRKYFQLLIVYLYYGSKIGQAVMMII